MLKVGLTGGIGSGKSTVSKGLVRLGVPVIDTDQIARQLLQPGQPLLDTIKERFGEQVFQADGQLDRHALRDAVFRDTDQLQALEEIMHPAIRQQVHAELGLLDVPYVIIAIPLLVEKGWQSQVDRVLVVDCEETQQLDRACARDGNDPALIRAIMAQQASRAQRLAAADEILHNDGSIEALHVQIRDLHQHYLTMSNDQPCKATPSTNTR